MTVEIFHPKAPAIFYFITCLLSCFNLCNNGFALTLISLCSGETFEMLDEYLKHLPKVKVLRQDARMGLIRARLSGAAYSKGEVSFCAAVMLLEMLAEIKLTTLYI